MFIRKLNHLSEKALIRALRLCVNVRTVKLTAQRQKNYHPYAVSVSLTLTVLIIAT